MQTGFWRHRAHDEYVYYQNALAKPVNGVLKQEFLHRSKSIDKLKLLIRTWRAQHERSKRSMKKPALYRSWLKQNRQLILGRTR
jgi:hypothetical protein